MTAPEDLPYSITGREAIAEIDGMRVQILTLGAGEVIPWHYHTTITDVFVGLEGRVVIETRAPRACHELDRTPGLQQRPRSGNHCVVPPLTAHQVSSKAAEAAALPSFRAWASTISTRSARLRHRTELSGIIHGVA